MKLCYENLLDSVHIITIMSAMLIATVTMFFGQTINFIQIQTGNNSISRKIIF
jgi:hypothetical protein